MQTILKLPLGPTQTTHAPTVSDVTICSPHFTALFSSSPSTSCFTIYIIARHDSFSRHLNISVHLAFLIEQKKHKRLPQNLTLFRSMLPTCSWGRNCPSSLYTDWDLPCFRSRVHITYWSLHSPAAYYLLWTTDAHSRLILFIYISWSLTCNVLLLQFSLQFTRLPLYISIIASILPHPIEQPYVAI